MTSTIQRNGEWFALTTRGPVPAAICGLAAGADAHLRDVEFPCGTCGDMHSAETLFSESDVPGDCPACADDFWCPKCGGHPDDCGMCADDDHYVGM